MNNGFILYRWFKNVPIAGKLYFTVGTLALLIGIEPLVLFFSLSILSSLLAYVGGKGLWSKAQKDAVFRLYRNGVSRTEADCHRFEQFMAVPPIESSTAALIACLLLAGRSEDIAATATTVAHCWEQRYAWWKIGESR